MKRKKKQKLTKNQRIEFLEAVHAVLIRWEKLGIKTNGYRILIP
jgi:hypothetical protein